MKDFLRSEWKTIVFFCLIFGGLGLFFYHQEEIAQSDPERGSRHALRPGDGVGPLKLGQRPEDHIALLGEPERRDQDPFGTLSYHYDCHGLHLYYRDGRTQTIRIDARPGDCERPSPEWLKRKSYFDGWPRLRRQLRQVRAPLADGHQHWARFAGITVISDAETSQITAMIIVPPPRQP